MGEQRPVIVRREVRPEQGEIGERQRALCKELEDDGKLARRAGGLDAMVSRMLGQVQHLCAVRKEGRAAFAEIQAARIELGEQAQELDGRVPFISGGARDGAEEIAIGEV
jgi:hypothetical protein